MNSTQIEKRIEQKRIQNEKEMALLQKKLTKAMNEETKRVNANFKKLSPAQKRVAIAKDVLIQLQLKKYMATAGTYFSTDALPLDKTNSLQHSFNKMESCDVCALGACFVSGVRLADKIKVDAIIDEGTIIEDGETEVSSDYISASASTMHEYLDGIFDEQQLALIECAFEGSDIQGVDNWSDRERAIAFGEQIRMQCEEDDNCEYGKRDRLILTKIMKNIVKNNGTFKP
jgi:hypothetical protein